MSYSGRGGSKPRRKKADLLAFEPPPMKKTTASRSKPMSDEVFAKVLEEAEALHAHKGGGGLGIPGKRKLDDVRKFARLEWKRKMPGQLKSILATSKRFRDDKVALEDQRQEVQKVNRRVVYEDAQMGEHSLHVGTDIAAVWNSEAQRKSKVYDYADLAPKIDKRIENGKIDGKKYFSKKVSADDRRTHTAAGMQHLLAGNNDKALESFQKSGATARGAKWLYKLSTIMLAERAREHNGGLTALKDSHVHAALEHVRNKTHTFKSLLASPQTKQLAPFALDGGAKTLKKE